MTQPPRPIAIGDIVHGHVAGWIGRDWYDCARVEAIGADWVVIRSFSGEVGTATCSRPGELAEELAMSRDKQDRYAEHSTGCPGAHR